ncbi:MAG: nucleic acid binding, OB-fold, tRNA/helicase-type, partial [Geminicoccaceae bacterium]|nr:nucleic acid binding, OB-fold, tRNA/helicase-type [Geminicoccaceae bacterium]
RSQMQTRRALTVEASVLQAGSTAPGQLSAKGLPGAMQAHCGVACGDAALRREGADAQALEIHPTEGCAILRLQGLDQTQHAAADCRLELGVRSVRISLRGQTVESPAPGISPAVMVGKGIPEHPVEPGCRRGGASERRCVVEAPDEGVLQDVLCFFTGSHPALQKRQKARVVIQQHLQDLWGSRVALGHLTGSRATRCIRVYSHPHPQPQPPSPQGHSAPQLHSQPQGHSLWVVSESRICRLRSGMDRYTSSPAYLLTHRSSEHYTPGVTRDGRAVPAAGAGTGAGVGLGRKFSLEPRQSRETDLPTGAGAMTSIARSVRRVPLAAALVLLAGCAGVTPIGELLDNSTKYDGKTVRVQGEVQEGAGALGVGAYQLKDNTGTITVVSDQGSAPRKGSDVAVKGRFESLFSLGRAGIAVIREESREAK